MVSHQIQSSFKFKKSWLFQPWHHACWQCPCMHTWQFHSFQQHPLQTVLTTTISLFWPTSVKNSWRSTKWPQTKQCNATHNHSCSRLTSLSHQATGAHLTTVQITKDKMNNHYMVFIFPVWEVFIICPQNHQILMHNNEINIVCDAVSTLILIVLNKKKVTQYIMQFNICSLLQVLWFCTSWNRTEYSAVYSLNGLMMS